MEPANVRMGVVGQLWLTTQQLTPLEAAQILDVALPVPATFTSLGLLTDDGFTHQFSEDVTEITTWTKGAVAAIIKGRELTMQFTALESTPDTLSLFYGSTFAGNRQTASMRITNGYSRRPTYTALYDVYDGDIVWRLIVPSARVAELDAPKYSTGQSVTWGLTLRAYDEAGYLAQWTTNDPAITSSLYPVSPPQILFPQPNPDGHVRPDATIGGLGMRGATVTVTTSDGQTGTCPVDPTTCTWSADTITLLPLGTSVTVSASQQLDGFASDPTFTTLSVYDQPGKPAILNVAMNGSTLTVMWTAIPSPTVDQWVFWLWKAFDGPADEQAMFTTNALGTAQFDIDISKFTYGTELAMQLEAAGPGVSQDSAEYWFSTSSYNPPRIQGTPTITGRTLTVSWTEVDEQYPESGYEIYGSTDTQAVLLGQVPPDTFTWTGSLDADGQPVLFPPGTHFEVFVRAATTSSLSALDSPRVWLTAPAT